MREGSALEVFHLPETWPHLIWRSDPDSKVVTQIGEAELNCSAVVPLKDTDIFEFKAVSSENSANCGTVFTV
jgi:hypothetical protein